MTAQSIERQDLPIVGLAFTCPQAERLSNKFRSDMVVSTQSSPAIVSFIHQNGQYKSVAQIPYNAGLAPVHPAQDLTQNHPVECNIRKSWNGMQK